MSPEKERKTLLLPPVLHPSLALGTCLRSILAWHCCYYIQSKSLTHRAPVLQDPKHSHLAKVYALKIWSKKEALT